MKLLEYTMQCINNVHIIDFFIGDEADKPGYGLKVCVRMECQLRQLMMYHPCLISLVCVLCMVGR